MNDKQRRSYARGTSVDAFMSANAADFPAGSKGGGLAARLKEELARLSTLDVAKVSGASARQQATAGRRELRDSLRAQLAAISDTAEVIGLDHPEVRGRFPRARPDNTDQTLLAVARSFVAAATPLKALFVEYELAPDFIARMDSDAEAFAAQMTRQTEGTGSRVSTNAAIAEALGRVDELVDRLHIVVGNKYRNDHAKFAAWESARHLERAPRSKRDGDSSQTPPPAQ
ncbi:MAG: hypothetical protein ABW208_11235 [Pyrinomonadaceae bacterium]